MAITERPQVDKKDKPQPFIVEHWRPEDARTIHRIEQLCWAPWLRQSPETFETIAYNSADDQYLIRTGDRVVASLTTNRIYLHLPDLGIGNPTDKLLVHPPVIPSFGVPPISSLSLGHDVPDTAHTIFIPYNQTGKEMHVPIKRLPTWDEIAGSEVSGGDYTRTYQPNGNAIALMSMNVDPEYRNKHLPSIIMEKVFENARASGVEIVFSPFRPSGYGEAKLQALREGNAPPTFEEYTATKMPDKARPGQMVSIDPWLRNLERNGMQPLGEDNIVFPAMEVLATAEELEEYRSTYNPDSWVEHNGVIECGEVGNWQKRGNMFVYREANFYGYFPNFNDQQAA